MALSLSDSLASAMADDVTAAVDAGAGPGTLDVYTGTKPATTSTAPTGTLLATFTLDDPAAAAAAAGVATVATSTAISTTVAADGSAGWFRVSDSTGTAVFDGEVGTTGGVEKDLNFDSVAWVTGGPVSIASGTITEPTA